MDPQSTSPGATISKEPGDGAAVATHLSPETGLPLTGGQRARFGLGFVLLGLFWAVGLSIVASVLLPQRLKDIGVASPEALLATMSMSTAIVSLVSNLVFGNLSDRSRSRFGKRGPWIFFGAIIAAVSLWSMSVFSDGTLINLAYCVSMVGLNMMLAPAVAVLADRLPLSLRGTMSAFFGAGSTAGYPLGAIIGAKLILVPAVGFVVSAVFMALAGIIAVVLWPRERDARDTPVVGGTSFKDLIVSFTPPRNAPDFYRAFVGRMLMLVSYQMINAYQLYIVQDYVGQSTEESAATIMTMSSITLVVGLIASFGAGPVSDLMGRRKAPVVFASVLFAIGIALPWIFPSSIGMYLFAGIAGFGYGAYSSVDQALNVDVLPNKEQAGKDLGILNLGTTLGQMVGPLITSLLVANLGGYGMVFPVAIVAAIGGAFIITRIRTVR